MRRFIFISLIAVLMTTTVTFADWTKLGGGVIVNNADALQDVVYINDTNHSLVIHRNPGSNQGWARMMYHNSSWDAVLIDSDNYHAVGNIPRAYQIGLNYTFVAYRDSSTIQLDILGWNSSFENVHSVDHLTVIAGSYPVPVQIDDNTSFLWYQDTTNDGFARIYGWNSTYNLRLLSNVFEHDGSYGGQHGVFLLDPNRTMGAYRGAGNLGTVNVLEWYQNWTIFKKAEHIITTNGTGYFGLARIDETHALSTYYDSTSGFWRATVFGWNADYTSFTNYGNLTFRGNYWCTYDIQNMNGSDFAFTCEDQSVNVGWLYQLRVNPDYSLTNVSRLSIAGNVYDKYDGMDKIDDYTLVMSYNTLTPSHLIGYYQLPEPAPAVPQPPLNGSGNESDPFEISRCEHFYNISWNNTAHYEIINDIDCANMNDSHNNGVIFAGYLHGNNYTVSNYYINTTVGIGSARCGWFNRLQSASFDRMILNNFTISCYNPASPGTGLGVGIMTGYLVDNITLDQVAIKNSYLDGVVLASALMGQISGTGLDIFVNDSYLYNFYMHPHTINGVGEDFVAPLATDIGNGNRVVNVYSDTDFETPQGAYNCFSGDAGGIFTGTYFNNETCNETLHNPAGATGITEAMFLDADLSIWDSYAPDTWYLQDGQFPILLYEYEKIPRVTLTYPNATILTTSTAFDVHFYVEDSDSVNSDCDLVLGGSVNQTNSSVDITVNTTLSVSGLVDGNHQYYISCTDGVYTGVSPTFDYEVDTTPPNITMLYPNVSNTSIANYTFTFDVTATDLNLDSYLLVLKYPDGSQVLNDTSSPTDTFHNLTGSPRGIYYVEVYANDTVGNTANLDAQFFLDDTVPPVCFGLSDSGVFYNSRYTWNVECYDERKFFSLNISCVGSDNYSIFMDNINKTMFSWGNYTVLTEPTTCYYEYCDGHTKKALKDKWLVKKSDDWIEFKLSKGKNKLSTDNEKVVIEYIIKPDKVSFDVTFDKVADYYILYYETSGQSYYYKDDDFDAWIVDYGTRSWFDLNDRLGENVIEVVPYNETTWMITVDPVEPNRNAFSFESTGELNCITGSQFLNITGYPSQTTLRAGVCPETTPGALILWLVVGVGVVFLVTGFRHPIIGVFGSLMLLVSSWTVAGCSASGGYVMAGAGLVTMIFFVFKKPVQ